MRNFFNTRLKTENLNPVDTLNPENATGGLPVPNNEPVPGPSSVFKSSELLLDIGCYADTKYSSNLNDRSECLILQNPWKPDRNYNFKADVPEGKRPFLYKWYSMYEWISYSKDLEGVFCKTCVLFRPHALRGSLLGRFITRPFTNFIKFHEHAKLHMLSAWHRESSEKAGNFLNVLSNKAQSIESQVNKHFHNVVAKNRTILKSILSTIHIILCYS